MTITTSPAFRHVLAALAATTLAACADGPVAGPDVRSVVTASAEADAFTNGPLPELGTCGDLAAPAGSTLTFKVFGKGVQIYRWDGARWAFVDPDAKLYADAEGNGLVGVHGHGPSWQTLSGSRVVGTVTHRCTPDASAIAWLRLDAVSTGSGVFEHTAFIQRLNTVGGLAPSVPGTFVGQLANVPYTSDYLFYAK